MVKLKLSLKGTSAVPKTPVSTPTADSSSSSSRPKIKLTSTAPSTPSTTKPKTPTIRFKPPAPRPKLTYPPGSGYDSESSEREADPTIEEQFIFRMQPGEDCELLRKAVEERTLDAGSDVWIKFKDQRRAVVNVKGRLYGAVLWDLPCVVESVKTLDRKATFKTGDICQMLEVQGRIEKEMDVFNYRITDHAYPHGLTAPLKYVRKRRFRKPRYDRSIDEVHEDVRRLLAADREAVQSSNELVDVSEMIRTREEAFMYGADYTVVGQEGATPQASFGKMEEDEDADAEGVDEDFDLFNELNAALEADAGDGAEATQVKEEEEEEDDSSDDDLFEDEDGVGGGPYDDDPAHEAAQEKQKIREELGDLKSSLLDKERELERTTNPIIQGRIRGHIANYRAEIRMKEQMLRGDDEDEEMGDA
ncbi:hypothetical protein BJ508DRAFT_419880, partial [Ascobolus immersus RN42]